MPACPNCGRRALRTKDWVCQWCGYPLLGGGFKTIDKTFKELQEERNSSYQAVEPEAEPDIKYEPEPEPEPAPKPEPIWKLRKAVKPTYKPKSPPEPEPRVEYKPEPEPQPRPAPWPASQPAPRPAAQPSPELAPQSRPELLPRGRPEPVLLPEAEKAPRLAPRPVAQPRPEPPPAEEPPPEPIKVPSLESITDGTAMTIDQIDALFRADNIGANAALKDKTLVIKGIVNKVFIRDHLDVRYLILAGARRGIWSARCSFEKESSPQMSHLAEGQAAALRGKYDGFSKNIIFKECELVGS